MRLRCDKCGTVYQHFDGHTCSVAKGKPAPALPKLIPSPKAASPKSKSGYERNKRWREAHPEAYKTGQRELMRKRRAKS